ncbi:DUF2239 family protein [Microvirga sp. 2YAF29]|uniref:DUF2239 family protein n=1 Tax=Microvirga sp. 2YAF29 TaxID=3233031 RepID=UPI003F9E4F44
MSHDTIAPYTAFAGSRHIASGDLRHVALKVKETMDSSAQEPVILDNTTCRLVEVDLRGTADDIVMRLHVPQGEQEDAAPRGPGRPKLGVVAREVTLLPRHWDWLNSQPGGASVALRKLVEDARRMHQAADRQRESRDALYRFMSMLAGDQPGFEEASRALFAGDKAAFLARIASWPQDLHDHARLLSGAAFAEP